MSRKRVLFLCVGNTCRSQMAEGYLRSITSDIFDVESAGAEASIVNPSAVKVMKEIGVDISNQKSKTVDEFMDQAFDYVVTLCASSAKRVCPAFIGKVKKRLHWDFDDPADAKGSEEEILDVYRRVRDEIKNKLNCFVEEDK